MKTKLEDMDKEALVGLAKSLEFTEIELMKQVNDAQLILRMILREEREPRIEIEIRNYMTKYLLTTL